MTIALHILLCRVCGDTRGDNCRIEDVTTGGDLCVVSQVTASFTDVPYARSLGYKGPVFRDALKGYTVFYFCVYVYRSIGQIKHQLDATLCGFYFCIVNLHVSGVKRPSSGVLKNWHCGPWYRCYSCR